MTTQSEQILAISKQLEDIKNIDVAYLSMECFPELVDRSTIKMITTKLDKVIDQLNKLSKKV